MPFSLLRSVGGRVFLNKLFDGFGEVLDVSIDPKTNMANLLVMLRGESAPLRLEVEYRVEPEHFVTVYFRCEREWIATLLNRFLAGHRFEVDNSVAQALLGMLL